MLYHIETSPRLTMYCIDRCSYPQVRKAGGNPIITNGYRVPCPDALVEVTNLKRDDDDEEVRRTTAALSKTVPNAGIFVCLKNV